MICFNIITSIKVTLKVNDNFKKKKKKKNCLFYNYLY